MPDQELVDLIAKTAGGILSRFDDRTKRDPYLAISATAMALCIVARDSGLSLAMTQETIALVWGKDQ